MAGLYDKVFGFPQSVIMTVGLVCLTCVALNLIFWIFRYLRAYVLSPLFGLHTDVNKLGKWSAVTGCTEGIGKAYAEELARMGQNIVLLSRSREKLERVAKDIESTSKVKTKVIVVAFSEGPDIYERIEKELAGLDVGVLVNNVGITSSARFDYFLDTPNLDQIITEIINVNILAATKLTRILLPAMVTRQKGAIINISSSAAKVPVPLLAIYSSTKAYIDFFSRALQMEYESKGIIVQSVLPYFVSTSMSNYADTSFFYPSATDYVRQALATLGVEDRTHGYFAHTLQGIPIDILPCTMGSRYWFNLLKKRNPSPDEDTVKEKTK